MRIKHLVQFVSNINTVKIRNYTIRLEVVNGDCDPLNFLEKMLRL